MQSVESTRRKQRKDQQKLVSSSRPERKVPSQMEEGGRVHQDRKAPQGDPAGVPLRGGSEISSAAEILYVED